MVGASGNDLSTPKSIFQLRPASLSGENSTRSSFPHHYHVLSRRIFLSTDTHTLGDDKFVSRFVDNCPSRGYIGLCVRPAVSSQCPGKGQRRHENPNDAENPRNYAQRGSFAWTAYACHPLCTDSLFSVYITLNHFLN